MKWKFQDLERGLGNEVAAPGCSAAAVPQPGWEEHLTHLGMKEGQHASSVGRLWRLGHKLRHLDMNVDIALRS